jgi:hypothetical protein
MEPFSVRSKFYRGPPIVQVPLNPRQQHLSPFHWRPHAILHILLQQLLLPIHRSQSLSASTPLLNSDPRVLGVPLTIGLRQMLLDIEEEVPIGIIVGIEWIRGIEPVGALPAIGHSVTVEIACGRQCRTAAAATTAVIVIIVTVVLLLTESPFYR